MSMYVHLAVFRAVLFPYHSNDATLAYSGRRQVVQYVMDRSETCGYRDRTDVQVLLSAQPDTGDGVQLLSALRLNQADIQDRQRTFSR